MSIEQSSASHKPTSRSEFKSPGEFSELLGTQECLRLAHKAYICGFMAEIILAGIVGQTRMGAEIKRRWNHDWSV